MKLFEEFKEYETMWEDTNVLKVVIYLDDKRALSKDEDFLRAAVEKKHPEAFVHVEYNKRRFMSDCEGAVGHGTHKYYTDAKGFADLKKACDKISSEHKDVVDKTLNNIIVID